jgi:hypothetical protein
VGTRESNTAKRRRQRSRLRRWAFLSVVAHLLVLALVIPRLVHRSEVESHVVTEVDLVDQEPEQPRATVQRRRPVRKVRRRARRRRARRRRPVEVARPAPAEKEEAPSELLIMRDHDQRPPAPEVAPPPPVPEVDRFASFRTGAVAPADSRDQLGSVAVVRYADGGRVLRSTGGPPNKAEVGLLELAAGKLGHGSGSQACDPYRGWRNLDRRDLILIVDTSGSVVRNRRAPASLVCAAGAALSALKRGFPVTVINFSSITQRYGPTRDIEVVYRALSTFQAQGTVLPRPELLKLEGGGPRDYVLISDAAIQNLKEVIPAYGKALGADRRNRAILYYLGAGVQDDINPAAALELIRRAGFRAEQVDRLRAGS